MQSAAVGGGWQNIRRVCKREAPPAGRRCWLGEGGHAAGEALAACARVPSAWELCGVRGSACQQRKALWTLRSFGVARAPGLRPLSPGGRSCLLAAAVGATEAGSCALHVYHTVRYE